MKATEIRQRAARFVEATVLRLKSEPFSTLRQWPDYPAIPEIDLQVPEELRDQKCVFTVMKDTLPNGDVRVAVQYARHRYLGMSDMAVSGFIISADGTQKELSKKDRLDLT
jgi:hypothetical protein